MANFLRTGCFTTVMPLVLTVFLFSCDGNDDEFGPFEYVLKSQADSLIIIDPSTNGGGWGGNWAITKFTEDELNVRILTIAGEAKMYLVK